MRDVPEWIGATPDTPIPKRVKLRVLIRYDGRCWRSKHKFRPGDRIEFDHIKALCNAPPGENWNRESNIAPILGGKVHQEKTREDLAVRVKGDRTLAKHLGIAKPKAGGFRGHRKFNGEIVWKDQGR